jgi:hypothetical protein
MSTAKHLSLQKFEPVDMSLRDAIILRPRASGVHGGIITGNATSSFLRRKITQFSRKVVASLSSSVCSGTLFMRCRKIKERAK